MNKNHIWKVFSKKFQKIKDMFILTYKLAEEPEPRAYNCLIYFNRKHLVRLPDTPYQRVGFFFMQC